ncbi:hypothetical protein SERLADRAFT_417352 [Serpula lacrymans var. lacrymans S7.9]|uniref:Major facilitator superfamily (MFS) profile domain-containing protein n=1 Tax=Serpula lacrymans var. lacrymans (strain S7.9) TaxID=578457 RepID=F8P5X7_SERL9|nr:uncharacterized protein SERLADRAFT_417352 [Serpula lacrymans var. lacrymans S7.9]EGO22014.1 hypothetical protein SERLADRAFT_417352 [Serpula lacrymans var. lacrymans S7.9]
MLGSLRVAFSMTVQQLLFWRFVQSFGAGAGLSVGIAVISDVFKVEERGTAMGISMAAQLIGPAIGPVYGGFATHDASWRVMQYAFAIASTASFLPILALSQRQVTRTPSGFCRAQIVLIICAIGAITLITDFALWVPLPFTVGERYGIHNEAWVGACFLPSGLGNIIGARIAGRISDNIVKRKREKGDGAWTPENRLRGSELGSLFLVPLSPLLSGFATRYIVFVLTPCATYMVDILYAHSVEVVAVEDGFRALLLSIITTAIVPSINTIAVLPIDTLTAIFALVAYGLLRFLIHYGARLRAWKDVGYSTANNN